MANSDPTHDAPTRIVFWERQFSTNIPKGWWCVPGKNTLCIGLYNNLQGNYHVHWKTNARYYAGFWKRHLVGKKYTIEPVTFEMFAAAYAHSTVAKEVPTRELEKLSYRLEHFPAQVRLWGVRRMTDGRIVAGLAAFDALTYKASHYSCGFYIPEVHQDHLMVALMDHWFADSLHIGMHVLHLGIFLPPTTRFGGRGKTISDFKAQFITHYSYYQPTLVRVFRAQKK